MTAAAHLAGLVAVLLKDRVILGTVIFADSVAAYDCMAGEASHLLEHGIDEEDAVTIVRDEHAFIQRLEDALHLSEPFRLFNIQRNSLVRSCNGATRILPYRE